MCTREYFDGNFPFEFQIWFQNRRMREKRLQKKLQAQGSRPDLLPINSPTKDQPLYGSPNVDMSCINDCIQKIQARKISQAMGKMWLCSHVP